MMNKTFIRWMFIVVFGKIGYLQAVQAPAPIYQISDVQGTFIQVPITHDIYRYSEAYNLQDIVVLDAENNAVPYRLVTTAPTAKEIEPKIVSTQLAFFPVASGTTPDTLKKLHTSQINVQGDTVKVTTSDQVINNQNPEFYLIDISHVDHDITSLVIDWDAQTNNQYLEVELDATQNLQDWMPLGQSTLVNIASQEQQVKRNHIVVNIYKKEYQFLRIRVLRGADNLHLTEIVAEQKIGSVEVQRKQETWRLVGDIAKVQTGVYLPSAQSKSISVAAWEFVRADTAPVDTIALDIGENTYGDTVKIFSRNIESQHWQLQHQGIWFTAQVGASWQKSDAVSVHHNSDKFWRIELNESAKNKITPAILFGWHPIELQIIANDKPPFVIAIADISVNNARDQIFNQLLSRVSAPPNWVQAKLIALDTKPETLANKQRHFDWRQWIFWCALIVAVIVLLIFSLKLLKQMNAESAPK